MSDEVAASSACWTAGALVVSAYSSAQQPGRAHPDPGRAERERGRDLTPAADPARGQHRHPVADRVDDLRDQHHAADLAGVPARLVALGDDDVDPARDLVTGVLRLPRQRRHQDAALVGACDDVGRGRAEGVGDQPGGVRERDLHVLARDRVQPADHPLAAGRAVRQRRHPEVAQRPLDEVPVRGRDQLFQVTDGALGGHPGGHDHVHPVGPPVGVRVHPVEHRVELGRVVEPDAAEHAKTAGPADRGGDVLGRGEADDRVVDAEQVADRRPHGQGALSAWAGVAGGCSATYRRAQP